MRVNSREAACGRLDGRRRPAALRGTSPPRSLLGLRPNRSAIRTTTSCPVPKAERCRDPATAFAPQLAAPEQSLNSYSSLHLFSLFVELSFPWYPRSRPPLKLDALPETPQATRGQCGPETRWLNGSGGTGGLPMCWHAGWQRDPTRMPARLPGRKPHLFRSSESTIATRAHPGRRMSGQRRRGEPRRPAQEEVASRDQVESEAVFGHNTDEWRYARGRSEIALHRVKVLNGHL